MGMTVKAGDCKFASERGVRRLPMSVFRWTEGGVVRTYASVKIQSERGYSNDHSEG